MEFGMWMHSNKLILHFIIWLLEILVVIAMELNLCTLR